MDDVAWGTVGEWVSGLGAFAAAAVAVIVPLVIWRHDRHERAAEHERRRSHTLAAWTQFERSTAPSESASPREAALVVFVANNGTEVITDWYVEVLMLRRATPDRSPRFEWERPLQAHVDGALPPGRQIRHLFRGDHVGIFGLAVVVFTDATGQRWRREGNAVACGSEADAMRAEAERAAQRIVEGVTEGSRPRGGGQ